MKLLELPNLLKGEWENLLILTFGADIPFFEQAIFPQIANRCRNKIILADAGEFAKACSRYTASGLIRHLNHRYLVAGITSQHAAHAKLILLTHPKRGLLLVGSGNLGLKGYASGGELFTLYEFNEKTNEHLPAFLAVQNFVQELTAKNYIGTSAEPYLRHIWESTPWLYHATPTDWMPVRSNLGASFLTQLQQSVGMQEVDDIIILSPFYDEKCVALQSLIAALKPKKCELLVQARITSIDSAVLAKIVTANPGRLLVRNYRLKNDPAHTGVHTKLVLVKTSTRSICLQGSPNLSQAAMLAVPPFGNIELANLLIGGPDEFDHLLENLEIDPPAEDLASLELALTESDDSKEVLPPVRLTEGDWQEDRLRLMFAGELPEDCFVRIGDELLALTITSCTTQIVEFLLTDDARRLLLDPRPVSLVWGDEENSQSNPVFILNISALNAELARSEDQDREDDEPVEIGTLDLDDDEMLRLISYLDTTTVIDRRSLWQMAGRILPKNPGEEDEEVRLDYAHIDYEQLRKHPKLIDYRDSDGLGKGRGAERTRLQAILNGIIQHFEGLKAVLTGQAAAPAPAAPIDQDEGDPEIQPTPGPTYGSPGTGRKRSREAKVRSILKNFLRRYLRGLKAEDFQQLVGPVVMTKNYVIFSHILVHLLNRNRLEAEFISDALQETWMFFWGGSEHAGYLRSLTQPEREAAWKVLAEYHHLSLMLAVFYYYGAVPQRRKDWGLQKLIMRGFARQFMTAYPQELDKEMIEGAWVFASELIPYHPPTPSQLVRGIEQLLLFDTMMSFLTGIEKEYDYREGSCSFRRERVFRDHLHDSSMVESLVIKDQRAIETLDVAHAIQQDWELYHPQDYYRIVSGDGLRLFFFDTVVGKGRYLRKDTGEAEPIHGLPAIPAKEWLQRLAEARPVAEEIDRELESLPFQNIIRNRLARDGAV